MNYKLIILLLLVIVFFSCNNKDKEDSISFRVDSEKIAKNLSFDSLSFSFSPPRGCIDLKGEIVNKFVHQGITERIDHDSTQIVIHYLGYDSSYAAYCTLSRIKPLNKNYSIKSIVELTQKKLLRDFSEEQVRYAQFKVNNLNVHQFLIMPEDKVFFKLLINPAESIYLQLDYAIDRKKYQPYISYIESSIGSIGLN